MFEAFSLPGLYHALMPFYLNENLDFLVFLYNHKYPDILVNMIFNTAMIFHHVFHIFPLLGLLTSLAFGLCLLVEDLGLSKQTCYKKIRAERKEFG